MSLNRFIKILSVNYGPVVWYNFNIYSLNGRYFVSYIIYIYIYIYLCPYELSLLMDIYIIIYNYTYRLTSYFPLSTSIVHCHFHRDIIITTFHYLQSDLIPWSCCESLAIFLFLVLVLVLVLVHCLDCLALERSSLIVW